MIKKVLFVFVLGLCFQLITGCVNCNCRPAANIHFTRNGLTLISLDRSLPLPSIAFDSVILSANYGLQLRLSIAETVLSQQKVNWGFIQTAQACSCAESNFVAREDISTVEIFSNTDFDISHPKNTDLSIYFKINRQNAMVSIAEYLKALKEFKYLGRTAFFEGIFLQVAPSIAKKHKFRVKITLSDGRILEAETTEVELI